MAKQSAIFALTFVALFALAFTFLAAMDALPEPVKSVDALNGTGTSPITETNRIAEAPVRIVAAAIGLDKTVLNPDSTDVAVLDAALLKGVVRYPQSALLGVNGTVLIFGHSSYLPIVRNQNFKAFDGIQDLKEGAVISVYSDTTEYRYAVISVRLANATEDVVELPSTAQYLKLITCNSFGTKSDRFIVTAEFVGAYAL